MKLPGFRLKVWMLMAAAALVAVGLYVRLYYFGFKTDGVGNWLFDFYFEPMDAETGRPLRDGWLVMKETKFASMGGVTRAEPEANEITESFFLVVRLARNGYTEHYYSDLSEPDSGDYNLVFQAPGYRPLKTTLREIAGRHIRFRMERPEATANGSGLVPMRDRFRVYLHRAARQADGPPPR